jgi:uncharacterized protein (DUF1501 family)
VAPPLARCIECEEIELARVSDQPPTQTLPVPYAALDGFPAGRTPRELTRRRLLQWGVAGVASVYAAHELGWDEVWESVAAAADDPPPRCLLLLYLAGGNDGLNTIPPSAGADYTAYTAARTVLHRIQGPSVKDGTGKVTTVGSLPLAGPAKDILAFSNPLVSTPGGGDNGAPGGLDTLWGAGTGDATSTLALMPAADVLKYSLSHFDNSDMWFSGLTSGVKSTGWLGRWIDRNGSDTNPLQAISIDTALSKSIRTAKMPVCAIPSLSALGFGYGMNAGGGYPQSASSSPNAPMNTQMDALADVDPSDGNAYLARSRATYGVAVETYNRAKLGPAFTPGGGYPANQVLAQRLQLAAHLFAANLGTRVVTIHWGGFDTHSGQIATQDSQLKVFSAALAAFQADLVARGIDDRVSTLVFSEFGRRVGENASAGTDHGAGGLMMAMGTQVQGGLGAQWPGLQKLTSEGSLLVPTDFRSVYASVISEWLADDPEAVLTGDPPAALVRGDNLTGGLFRT